MDLEEKYYTTDQYSTAHKLDWTPDEADKISSLMSWYCFKRRLTVKVDKKASYGRRRAKSYAESDWTSFLQDKQDGQYVTN